MRHFIICFILALSMFGATEYRMAGEADTLHKDDILRDQILRMNANMGQVADTPVGEVIASDIHIIFIKLNKELTKEEDGVSSMEALDRIKKLYAANFEKVTKEASEEYYYKLPGAEYYLVNEGLQEDKYYLIHLYEFVMDDPETGIGHTVTYGWYQIDKTTGKITVTVQY